MSSRSDISRKLTVGSYIRIKETLKPIVPFHVYFDYILKLCFLGFRYCFIS